MLRSVGWWILTDVSGQPVLLAFKSQRVQEESHVVQVMTHCMCLYMESFGWMSLGLYYLGRVPSYPVLHKHQIEL